MTDTASVSRTPLETVREQYDAVNNADWDRSIALWSEDIVLDVRGGGVNTGVHQGLGTAMSWFVDWFSTFEAGAHFELTELVELEDGSVLAVSTHRARGARSGVAITGQVMWRYIVEDGRIIRQVWQNSREEAIAAAASDA
ncbi:MAG: hypothetical protein QOI31_2196 [Solirubrobacterales bacterium]|jgi:ketosteroid isomerase-like protein|nr:hypothetical protein [Solirubrobacterales bacterium]